MNEQKLNEFLGQLLNDLGGAFSVGLVRIGQELGLYRALVENGPVTSTEFAKITGFAERYLREWLSHHAASNYISYDADSQRFELPAEQAAVFADEDSPVFMLPAFDAAAAYLENQPRVQAAFKSGKGVGWGKQAGCLFCAVARFFRPGYKANLVSSWLPALDGVVEKLERGARVADIGCGHGYSTVLMAEAYPNSQFIGIDFHASSVEEARLHAEAHHVTANTRFEVGTAQHYPGGDFDLVTFFDCLHDMGDPASAAANVKRALKLDGTWMIVEPYAHDALEDNLNPVSRLFYAASTMVCVPTSLDQPVGVALGAQAGEYRLRGVVEAGGFAHVRRATETPFNLVLEARC